MRKNTFKVSTISVLCALCAGLTTNAMAAGTVRSLGGAGTYSGTSAASASTRSPSARAGSLRISPAMARMETSASPESAASGATNARAAGSQQRLSIGKYLGGAVTTSATTQARNNAAVASVDSLETKVDEVQDVLDNMRNGSSDGVIEIAEDGTVSLNIEVLKPLLSDGDEIEFDYNADTHVLLWREAGGTTWNPILNVDNLATVTSVTALQTEINNALALKADKTSLQALEGNITTLQGQVAGLSSGEGSVSAQINTALANYTTTSDMNTMLNGKQAVLTEAQLAAVNSGVTGTVVSQVTTNKTDIASLDSTVGGHTTSISNLNAKVGSGALPESINNTAVADIVGAINALKAKTDSMATGDSVSGIQSAVDALETALSGKQDLIPANTYDAYGDAAAVETKLTAGAEGYDINAKSLKVQGVDVLTSHNPIDSALSDSSTNAVQNKVVKAALDGKQNTIDNLEVIIAGAAAGATAVQPAAITDMETKTNAAATYETKTNAAATYETKTNAAATYQAKGDYAILPDKSTCTAASGTCVLAIDKDTGAKSWIAVTDPLN